MDAQLDNPIWHALTTEQTHFAERAGDAARFAPAVTQLAGLRVTDDAALAALARLIRPGEIAGVLLDEAIVVPAGLAQVDVAGVLQMVHDGDPPPVSFDGLVELGPADVPEMIALAEATRPGPFGTRTRELGTFLGIRADGVLAAMAGQRMRLPGLIEVSGVCTDPAHLGRGHAARLISAQLGLIHDAGAAAFLHVKDDNARAIALYERFGFRGRHLFRYVILRGVPT